MEDPRTLDDDRLAQLRTAVVVAAAADLARTAEPVRRAGPRRLLVGAAAAVALGLGALAVAGAVGGGPAGPTPSAAATIEVDDGWVTVTLGDGAEAGDVRDLLLAAGIDAEVLVASPVAADGSGGGGPVPATAAQAQRTVTFMATSTPEHLRDLPLSNPLTPEDRALLEAAHEEAGIRMDFSDGEAPSRSVEFRQGAAVTVRLYVLA